MLARLMDSQHKFHGLPLLSVFEGCLLSAYAEVCGRLSIPALDVDEVYSALSLLESQSLLESKPASYQLLVDTAAAKKIISDTTLISQINTISLGSNSG